MAFAKLYTAKIPVTAADTLNDRVLPFFDEHDIPILRVLTDRGTDFCGSLDKHPYELYLQLNEIEHTKTKVKSPQTNGICERFHQTVLNEFYRVAFRKKLYGDLETLQTDLDQYMDEYTMNVPIRGNDVKVERLWKRLSKVSNSITKKTWNKRW